MRRFSSVNDERRTRFERLYAANSDPWDLATSDYEAAKRDATIDALGASRFDSALEVGCALGLLTERLAARCDALLAIDTARNVLAVASERLTDFPHVSLMCADIPAQWPDRTYDLIVLSEVLYFLSAEEIAVTSRLAMRSLDEGGICLLVNWTGENDLPVSGPQAVDLFLKAGKWKTESQRSHDCYRIDVFSAGG
jgi:predicted TPR repeat methyltransferase